MLNNVYSEQVYTLDEFLEFSESMPNNRYELVDGYIYAMAGDSATHQDLVLFISDAFRSYFKGKKCRLFVAPLDVFLFYKKVTDCKNCYQPDVLVVCNKSQITERGIYGAPDLVVEVVSDSSRRLDSLVKLNNYLNYGVRECWIIDYKSNQINVHSNTDDGEYMLKGYNFGDIVYSNVFDNLCVNFSAESISEFVENE